MIDPMAGIGATNPAATDPASENTKEVFDPMALNMNLRRIDKIRTFMGIVSGCVAGVLGLTGLQGLVCFLVLHMTILVAIAGVKMGFQLKKYTRQSWFGYATMNLQQSALSFVLFWTLFYGLVYLY